MSAGEGPAYQLRWNEIAASRKSASVLRSRNSVDDGTIVTSVKGSLLTAKGVPSSDVNVEVYKGVVLLSGFVKTQAEKDAAGKVAKDGAGNGNRAAPEFRRRYLPQTVR